MFNLKCELSSLSGGGSEQCGIPPHVVDALLCDVEILLVGLEAYEVPMLHQSRHSRCAAANRRVENYPPTLEYVSIR